MRITFQSGQQRPHIHTRTTAAQRRRPNTSKIKNKGSPSAAIYTRLMWSVFKFQNIRNSTEDLYVAEMQDLCFAEASAADKSWKAFILTMQLRVEANLYKQLQICIQQFGTKQSWPKKQFPPRQLTLAMQQHLSPRVIQVNGCSSHPFPIFASIL